MKIFAIIIGALGLYICAMNYIAIGVSLYNRKRDIDRHASPIGLLSGLLMFVAAVILLPESFWALSFIAFALDYTYPSLVYAIVKGYFK